MYPRAQNSKRDEGLGQHLAGGEYPTHKHLHVVGKRTKMLLVCSADMTKDTWLSQPL